MREAGHNVQWVRNRYYDHGNCSSGILGRQSSRRSPRDDQIYFEVNQFGGQVHETFAATFRRAVFNNQVLTLDVSGFPQRMSERIQTLLSGSTADLVLDCDTKRLTVAILLFP